MGDGGFGGVPLRHITGDLTSSYCCDPATTGCRIGGVMQIIQVKLGDKLKTSSRFGKALDHYGVFAGWRRRDGQAMVVHNAKEDGVVLDSWDRFCNGAPVYIIQNAVPGTEGEVLQRALSYIGTNYDLLSFNCEHFAAIAHGEQPRSQQLANAALLALVGGALWALRDEKIWDENVGQYRRRNGQFAGS